VLFSSNATPFTSITVAANFRNSNRCQTFCMTRVFSLSSADFQSVFAKKIKQPKEFLSAAAFNLIVKCRKNA
jgi:hypothetical protein